VSKCCPHEFGLLIRQPSAAGLDGLPSGVKRGKEDAHGVRIKDYVILEEVTHLAPPGCEREIAL